MAIRRDIKYIAYNVAYLETKYQGPFDWDYHGKLTSYAGAQGPMQIITRWAHQYAERRITEKELRTNIDLNVMISMKTFENAEGGVTGYRPCTILYKGKVVRATIWESVVAQGVKLNDECTVAVTRGFDRNNKPAIYLKVIGGSALLPDEEMFADVLAEEKELSI